MSLATFALVGALISLSIWLVQRTRWNKWIRLFCLLATIVAIIALLVFPAKPVTLGEESHWYDTSPYLELIFCVLMLMGMSARYITKAIETRRERILELQKQGAIFVKPALEFDIWEFSYPLFISVVTYGALLTQVKDHTLSVANATLSFQSGFFWQTILAAKQKP
jgi:hypothetical protein